MIANFDVICIGAALVDMVAQVERHPVDDDEVFVSQLQLLSGGAAANTAYACAKIGLSTAFLGKLGTDDIFGNKIIEDLNKIKVNTSLIKYSKDYGTGSAYVALDKRGDRRIYAYSGAANYLSKEDIIESEIKTAKIIFLSSLKNLEPFIEAAKMGKKNSLPIILNPGMLIIDQGLEIISELLKNIDIFILSQREFTTLFNLKEKIEEKKLKEKANILLSYGIKTLIITMGKKGAFLFCNDNSELIPSRKVKDVVDTTGAGDAFSAGFVYGFAQDLSFEFSNVKRNVALGNFIAGNCIQQLGARNGIPTAEEVKQIIFP